MPNPMLITTRALANAYPYSLFGGPNFDGRHIPNIPDGVLKAIDRGGLIGQVGPHTQVLGEVVTATHAFVASVAAADQLGTDISAVVDEYIRRCGNEPWPFPKGWPKPGWLLPVPEVDGTGKPQPQPWLTQQMRVLVALTLTALGDQLDTDLGSTLVEGAAQLFEIASTTRSA